MRLMTLGEFRMMFTRSNRDESIEHYAKELGSGWRLWAMLELLVASAIAIMLMYDFPLGIVLWIAFGAIVGPMAMTFGFLMGALVRNYSVGDLLKRSYHHFQ